MTSKSGQVFLKPEPLMSSVCFSLLGASEEVVEVSGGASGMGVDRIGEVGDWASEGQAAGVYGAGFTAGSLAIFK